MSAKAICNCDPIDRSEESLEMFTFRFNRPKSRSRCKLFCRLLEQAVAVEPAPYKSLIKCRAQPDFRNHKMLGVRECDKYPSGANWASGRTKGGQMFRGRRQANWDKYPFIPRNPDPCAVPAASPFPEPAAQMSSMRRPGEIHKMDSRYW